MLKFSIVLPVYNGELHLKDTINSILNQSYTSFELIIVDDGSQDRSKDIINYYALKDCRIKTIMQNNQGICKARNTGILASSGEYILFCDHDDIYNSDFLKYAEEDLNRVKYDFIKFSCEEIYVKSNGKTAKKNICKIDNNEYIGDVRPLLFEYSDYNEYIWDGVYKKNLLIKIGMFDTNITNGCEDVDLMLKLIVNGNNCKTDSRVAYYHYIRDNGSTSRKYSDNTYKYTRDTYYRRVDLAESLRKVGKYKDKYQINSYCIKKTEQYAWALMGMFSFSTCKLNYIEISKRLKIDENNKIFCHYISIPNKNVSAKKKVIYSFFAHNRITLLSILCVIKRNIT